MPSFETNEIGNIQLTTVWIFPNPSFKFLSVRKHLLTTDNPSLNITCVLLSYSPHLDVFLWFTLRIHSHMIWIIIITNYHSFILAHHPPQRATPHCGPSQCRESFPHPLFYAWFLLLYSLPCLKIAFRLPGEVDMKPQDLISQQTRTLFLSNFSLLVPLWEKKVLAA